MGRWWRVLAVAVTLVVASATAADAGTIGTRAAGVPTSANGASSMHVRAADSMPATPEASVVLEVRQAPTVAAVYFWALQVDFVEHGVVVAGAHLGLLWDPAHPSSRAANFGGYERNDEAVELTGRSTLPSANNDPNTRDFAWAANTPYRLRIFRGADGWWTGEITDLVTGRATVVRRLHAGGTMVVNPIVWSEVFARCDAPTTAVRWSAFTPAPARLRATYQTYAQGGCTNTSSAMTTGGVVQRTNVARSVEHWAIL